VSSLFLALCVVVIGWEPRRLFASAKEVSSEVLELKKFVVRGNERLPTDEILRYTGLKTGTNILDANLAQANQNLAQHPWVERVTIRRVLPDSVEIVVYEQKPALIVSMSKLYVADAKGVLFKRFSFSDQLDLPVLTGIPEGTPLEGVEQLVREALELLDSAREQSSTFGRIDELHWDPDLFWSIVVEPTDSQQALTIHLGQKPLRRFPNAREAIRILDSERLIPTVLWVDGKKRPERVHARLLRPRKPQLNED